MVGFIVDCDNPCTTRPTCPPCPDSSTSCNSHDKKYIMNPNNNEHIQIVNSQQSLKKSNDGELRKDNDSINATCNANNNDTLKI